MSFRFRLIGFGIISIEQVLKQVQHDIWDFKTASASLLQNKKLREVLVDELCHLEHVHLLLAAKHSLQR